MCPINSNAYYKQEYKAYYKNEIATERAIFLSSVKSTLVNDEALLDDFLEEYELAHCAGLIRQLTPYEKSKFLIELLKYRKENISSQAIPSPFLRASIE